MIPTPDNAPQLSCYGLQQSISYPSHVQKDLTSTLAQLQQPGRQLSTLRSFMSGHRVRKEEPWSNVQMPKFVISFSPAELADDIPVARFCPTCAQSGAGGLLDGSTTTGKEDPPSKAPTGGVKA